MPWLENQRGPDVKTLIQEVIINNVGCMRVCVYALTFFFCCVPLFMQATTEKISAQGEFVCDQAVLISDKTGSCS